MKMLAIKTLASAVVLCGSVGALAAADQRGHTAAKPTTQPIHNPVLQPVNPVKLPVGSINPINPVGPINPPTGPIKLPPVSNPPIGTGQPPFGPPIGPGKPPSAPPVPTPPPSVPPPPPVPTPVPPTTCPPPICHTPPYCPPMHNCYLPWFGFSMYPSQFGMNPVFTPSFPMYRLEREFKQGYGFAKNVQTIGTYDSQAEADRAAVNPSRDGYATRIVRGNGS